MVLKHNNIIIGINLGDYGSTGNIMRNALEYANEYGDFDYLVIVPKAEGKPNTYAYFEQNNIFDKLDRRCIHKSIGNPDGFYEYRATIRIINKIKEVSKQYNKTIVHLHNIHHAHIDLRYLFSFLAKEKRVTKVFYTLHDVWSYTGGCYCYHFAKCDKWRSGCKCNCPQNYGTIKLSVETMFDLKNKYTNLLKSKTILIPVSNWLNEELNNSFLKDYCRVVINGETNIESINKCDQKLKERLGLKDKKIILTVSAYWDEWKGPKYIYDVSSKLSDDYVIVVVGGKFDTTGHNNIIHIDSVDQKELAHYFSIADVYMSTSQSESLGLTTCEAQICGVPVVAFGHTAIKETFIDGKTGILVGEDNNIDNMVKAIVHVIKKKPFNIRNIINNGQKFQAPNSSMKYLDLYNSIC